MYRFCNVLANSDTINIGNCMDKNVISIGNHMDESAIWEKIGNRKIARGEAKPNAI